MEFVGYIASSLDGFIAREDGSLDWLEQDCWSDPDGSDYGWKDHLSSVDALIMGKNTFLKISEIGQWIYGDLPVFVASKSLKQKEVPENLKDKITIFLGSIHSLVREMKILKKKRIYIDGGNLLQSFIRENLLNELILTRIPILIGKGISFFGALGSDIKVDHVKTKTYKSGLCQSFYRF